MFLLHVFQQLSGCLYSVIININAIVNFINCSLKYVNWRYVYMYLMFKLPCLIHHNSPEDYDWSSHLVLNFCHRNFEINVDKRKKKKILYCSSCIFLLLSSLKSSNFLWKGHKNQIWFGFVGPRIQVVQGTWSCETTRSCTISQKFILV